MRNKSQGNVITQLLGIAVLIVLPLTWQITTTWDGLLILLSCIVVYGYIGLHHAGARVFAVVTALLLYGPSAGLLVLVLGALGQLLWLFGKNTGARRLIWRSSLHVVGVWGVPLLAIDLLQRYEILSVVSFSTSIAAIALLGVIFLGVAVLLEHDRSGRFVSRVDLFFLVLMVPFVWLAQEGGARLFVFAAAALLVPPWQVVKKDLLPPPSIDTTLNMNRLLDDVVRQVRSVAKSDVVYIASFAPEKADVLNYRLISHGADTNRGAVRALRPDSPESSLLQSTQVFSTSDAKQIQQLSHEDLAGDNGVYLGIPMVLGSRVVGIVGALRKRGAYDAQEQAQLQQLARQTSLALQSSILFSQSRDMVKRFGLINESVQFLLFNLDSQDVIHTVCQTAMAITGANRAALFLLDQELDEVGLAYHLNLTEAHVAALKQITQLGDPKVVRDVDAFRDDAAVIATASKGGYRAYAETPLFSGENNFGMLVVYHDEAHDYTDAELDLVRMLANQVTIALENAELLNALELYASEMAQLVHLSRQSLASLQPEEVAEEAVNVLRKMFATDSVVIAVLQTEPDHTERIRVLGAVPENLKSVYGQPLEAFPELHALKEPATSRRDVLYQRNMSDALARVAKANHEDSIAVAPMSVNNKLLGVMILGCKVERTFSDRAWQFIETAANLIAAQIQNAQLYNATSKALAERLDQLAYLENLVKQISSALEIDQIIDTVLETTVRATQADTVVLVQQDAHSQYRIIRYERENGVRDETFTGHVNGVIEQVLQSGETLLSPAYGLPEDKQTTPPYGAYPSVLAVPLIQDQLPIGVLSAESRQRNFFTHEQAKFMNSLAGHTVISIANAQFLEERQHQIETLTDLRQLSLKVSGVAERHIAARHILDAAMQMVGAQKAAVYHYHLTLKKPVLLASPWTEDQTDVDDTVVPTFLPAIVAQRAVETGEIQVIRSQEDGSLTGKLPHATILAVPILRGEHVSEILALAFNGVRTFTPRDFNTLQLLAAQAAGHFETTILYNQIRAANDRMRTILDSTHDGIILLDRQDRIIDANPSADSILGLTLTDYFGTSFSDLPLEIKPVDEDASAFDLMGTHLQARTNAEEISRRQFERTEADKSIFIEQTSLPVRDARRRVVGRLLVLRDVTEERELAAYRKEIIYMLVHDLRGPLGSISAGLRFAKDLINDPESLNYLPEVIDLAHSSANRLMRLVNTLLDVEREQMQLIKDRVSIEDLITDATKELMHSAREVGIEIERKMLGELPAAHIDREKIERVIINLVDNALDYAERHIILSVDYDPEAGLFQFQVVDDGPGVPKERRSSIFGKFEQGDHQEKRRGKHTGIGLTYCRRAVEAHGGQIWVTDGCDLPGACFAFTLPIKDSSAN